MNKRYNRFIVTVIILTISLLTLSMDCFANGQASVFIIRKSLVGAIFKFPIIVNNIQLQNIGVKKYIECRVPAGEVKVDVLSETIDGITFNAQAGKNYYVIVNPAMGVLVSRAKLAMLSSYDGEKLVGKYKCQQLVDLVMPVEPTIPNVHPDEPVLALTQKKAQKTKVKKTPKTTPDVSNEVFEIPTYVNSAASTTTNVVTSASSPVANYSAPSSSSIKVESCDIDVKIPTTRKVKEDTFVLIIANENYAFVDDVEFALNDGKVFREYCIKTLGIPEKQVWLYNNASLGLIAGGVDKMVQAMKIFDNAHAIVYYCGHGIPDEKTGDAFIVPVDGKGTNTTTCYSLNNLYQSIASANPATATYFMDACFTGANRDGAMLVAARGVAREPKKVDITGNTIVFSAASGDETAMPYKEMRHGLFTYYLLKKLQETKGIVNYGELADYLIKNVKKEAFLTNEKPQNPVVATSQKLSNSWRNIHLNK